MKSYEPLEKLVELALWTGHLIGKDEQPVSLLIVAPVGTGKSTLVGQFSNNAGIVFPIGINKAQIIKAHMNGLVHGDIKHMIFSEFKKLLNKGKAVTEDNILFLNTLIEEGYPDIELQGTTLHFDPPVKAGIIACITDAEYSKRKDSWTENGFLSRSLTISYKPGSALIELLKNISQGDRNIKDIRLNFHNDKINLPNKISEKLQPYAFKVCPNIYSVSRSLLSLQRMIKALALSKGKSVVDQSDLDEFIPLLIYVNDKFNEIPYVKPTPASVYGARIKGMCDNCNRKDCQNGTEECQKYWILKTGKPLLKVSI